MNEAGAVEGGKKTVQVDLATLSSGGKSGSRKNRSRSSSRRSESKVDIAAKSAELQAAVEQALTAAGRPGRPDAPPPRPSSAAQRASGGGGAGASAGTTKRVSSDLLGQPVAADHPRSASSVANAVQELNQLMQQRLQARMRKTMRAGARRDRQQRQQLSAPAEAEAEESITQPRPGTPLAPDSTAARVANDPPWGCLKGGDKQTWREYKHHTTVRAARKRGDPASTTLATPATPQHPAAVSLQTVVKAPTPTPRPGSTTPPLAGGSGEAKAETVTVGRQSDGRVAFVVGDQGRRTRTNRSGPQHRSVTNRTKLRKARLTKGGSQTPQRLIDVIADSVDSIGSVVNVHSRAPAT
jgi:hypothetical protein